MAGLRTYLITMSDGSQIVCGNNYKTWLTHAYEYRRNRRMAGDDVEVANVKQSFSKFYDDGGLKWATPEAYSEIMKKLGEESKTFADIKFEEYGTGLLKLRRMIERGN